MKFAESLGEMTRRIKQGGKHMPLRKFKEICEELGVPQKTVMGRLKMDGAPTPILRHNGSRGNAAWYEPVGFKKWWASLEPVNPTIPTRHCDECLHWDSDANYKVACRKGHHPRYYQQDMSFKKRCTDYDEAGK